MRAGAPMHCTDSLSRLVENRRFDLRNDVTARPRDPAAQPAPASPASVPPSPALLKFPNLAESHQLVHLADR